MFVLESCYRLHRTKKNSNHTSTFWITMAHHQTIVLCAYMSLGWALEGGLDEGCGINVRKIANINYSSCHVENLSPRVFKVVLTTSQKNVLPSFILNSLFGKLA